MHKRTFDVLKRREVVTVWQDGPFRGMAGTVADKRDLKVVVSFADGRRGYFDYKKVCCGDNSFARYPEED